MKSTIRGFGIQAYDASNNRVLDGLKRGIARIGWSYGPDLDLRKLAEASERRRLTKREKKAWRAHHLFLGEHDKAVQKGDLLFYRNMPDQGRVTVVQVTGEYRYLPRGGDFRSYRSCRVLVTGRSVDDFAPSIRASLKIQGRFHHIGDDSAVRRFFVQRSRRGLKPPKFKPKERPRTSRKTRRASDPNGSSIYWYLSQRKRIRVVRRHNRYQIALRDYLLDRDIESTLEENFVDIHFKLGGRQYLGEVKVTDPPSTSEAFRMALGQLFEYRHTQFSGKADPIFFLDHPLDQSRLDLATELGVAVVSKSGDKFDLLNSKVNPRLRSLFRV
jgi:hypothetical protein